MRFGRMSIEQMNRAWNAHCETHTMKLVLVALADNSNDSGACWPSVTTLARKCSLTRQSVIDQIAKLEDKKWLTTEREGGKSNRYCLSIPVNRVDQSTALTSQQGLPAPVNAIDYHQSTPLTTPVNRVDPNHQEPSFEPSKEPPKAKRNQSGYSVPGCFEQVDGFTEALAGWIEARKLKKNPPTGYAIQLVINRLAERPRQSVPALEMAIERGWQTVKWTWFDKENAKDRADEPQPDLPDRTDELGPCDTEAIFAKLAERFKK